MLNQCSLVTPYGDMDLSQAPTHYPNQCWLRSMLPILTDHQICTVAFAWERFHMNCPSYKKYFALIYRHDFIQIRALSLIADDVKYQITTVSVNVPELVQSLYSQSGQSSYHNISLSQSRSHEIGSYIDRTALKLNRHPDKWYIYLIMYGNFT